MTHVLMAVRIAHRALRRNTLRSALTMLGVIIEVAAVIAMLAIGQGAQAAIRAQIASLGSHALVIQPGSTTQLVCSATPSLVRNDRVGRGIRLDPQRAVGQQPDLLRRRLLRRTVRPSPHPILQGVTAECAVHGATRPVWRGMRPEA